MGHDLFSRVQINFFHSEIFLIEFGLIYMCIKSQLNSMELHIIEVDRTECHFCMIGVMMSTELQKCSHCGVSTYLRTKASGMYECVILVSINFLEMRRMCVCDILTVCSSIP